MISKTTFLEKEIPYFDFLKLGKSQRDILNMPKTMLEKLMKGEITPIMELRPKGRGGTEVPLLAKVQIVRDQKGNPTLRVYPVAPQIINSMHLREDEIQQLKDGKTILKEQRSNEARKLMYIELDPETNHLITADAKRLKINERISNIQNELKMNGISNVKDIELGENQKQQIREGKPVELVIGDKKVTVGVSLKDAQGFKVMQGDMEEWKRTQEVKWDMANPGKIGFWKTDQNRWEYEESITKFFTQRANDNLEIEHNVSRGMRR